VPLKVQDVEDAIHDVQRAARLLKGFSNQLTHGLAKRKTPIDPTLGAELGTLVGEARGELAGLGTS